MISPRQPARRRATSSSNGLANVDDPHQFILLEAFESRQAGEAHVNSDHFRTMMAWAPDVIVKTPEIVNVEVPQHGWGEMAELTPR